MHTSMALQLLNADGDDNFPLDWKYANWFITFSFSSSFLAWIKSQLLFKTEEKQACELEYREEQIITLYMHLESVKLTDAVAGMKCSSM